VLDLPGEGLYYRLAWPTAVACSRARKKPHKASKKKEKGILKKPLKNYH